MVDDGRQVAGTHSAIHKTSACTHRARKRRAAVSVDAKATALLEREGHEVLTAAIPKELPVIEAMVGCASR